MAGVDENNVEQVLEDIIKAGADIIFCVGPQMMPNSLKVAVEHPEVYILNCSLNAPHPYIRTYYGRMYEAKFHQDTYAQAHANTATQMSLALSDTKIPP